MKLLWPLSSQKPAHLRKRSWCIIILLHLIMTLTRPRFSVLPKFLLTVIFFSTFFTTLFITFCASSSGHCTMEFFSSNAAADESRYVEEQLHGVRESSFIRSLHPKGADSAQMRFAKRDYPSVSSKSLSSSLHKFPSNNVETVTTVKVEGNGHPQKRLIQEKEQTAHNSKRDNVSIPVLKDISKAKQNYSKPSHVSPEKNNVSLDLSRLKADEKKTAFAPESSKSWRDLLKSYSSRGSTLRSQFNCKKLFEGDKAEQEKVTEFNNLHNNSYPTFPPSLVPSLLSDCEAFKVARGYRTGNDLTPEEREFPLAFVLLAHLDFEHVERLFRTLYTPQNVVCVHLDAKAPESLQRALQALVTCFPKNLVMSSAPQRIVYAHVSRLLADVSCMRDLVKSTWSWRYLINMAATELPLKSNLETIHVLKTFHGLNDIRETEKGTKRERFEWAHNIYRGRMKKSKDRLPPPPHNITIVKGLAYNTYSREFMDWAMSDQRALDLLKWSERTFSPDEHYWASLNNLYHNSFLNTPGGFRGDPDKKGYVTKFISWQQFPPQHKCNGRVTHNICLFSSLDLPVLVGRRELAANKFDLTYDPVAYACVEEAIENRTRSKEPLDLSVYERLYFIRFNPSENKS